MLKGSINPANMDVEVITTSDFQSLCRICMRNSKSSTSSNVNGTLNFNKVIDEDLYKHAVIQVSMCKYTLNQVLPMYTFCGYMIGSEFKPPPQIQIYIIQYFTVKTDTEKHLCHYCLFR